MCATTQLPHMPSWVAVKHRGNCSGDEVQLQRKNSNNNNNNNNNKDVSIPNSHNLHSTITEKLQNYTNLKE
jgi:hypothetical protein